MHKKDDEVSTNIRAIVRFSNLRVLVFWFSENYGNFSRVLLGEFLTYGTYKRAGDLCHMCVEEEVLACMVS